MWYTSCTCVCKKCFFQTEEGKANRSNQFMKQYQQQRRTRSTMEISRGMHGITSDVIRTFQQERVRCESEGGAEIAPAARNHSICGIVCRLTIGRRWKKIEASLRGWWALCKGASEDRCQPTPTSLRCRRTFCGKSTEFVQIRMVSDTEVGFLIMSYVCPHCGLFPIEDSVPWVRKEHE